MDRSSMSVGRLSYQTNAKGCTHLINCVKSRFGVWLKRFIQGFTGYSCSFGNFTHTTSLGSYSQSVRQLGGITVFNHHGDVSSNVFFAFKLLGHIKIRQICNSVFHVSILQSGFPLFGLGNVALLAALVSPTKHDDQNFASLGVVHSPAWTVMFPHFKDAFAHWFYITEVATLCFIETAA